MARMDTDGGQPGLPFASVWERECPARSKPGSAGVSPQAWERGRLARLRAGRARTQSIRTPNLPLRPVWEHCGAIAIAGDRNEFRSTLAPPGSAVVSPACAPEARAPRASPLTVGEGSRSQG